MKNELGSSSRLLLAFFIIALPVSACSILSWEAFEIFCSVNEKDEYYQADTIILDFSVLPDKKSMEEKASLQLNNLAVNTKKRWYGNSLHICPVGSWQKGQTYKLIIDGSVKMNDGRIYNSSLFRAFCYGEPGNEFTIKDSFWQQDSLTLCFSKPVSISSFREKFSLQPYLDCQYTYSEDLMSVNVKPKTKCRPNVHYKWRLADMVSSDGYLMNREYTGMISGIMDSEIPELLSVCPVDYSAAGSLWYYELELGGNLYEWQAAGFSFSKAMDAESVKTGISFVPSIQGYFVKEDDKHFIFIPDGSYEPKKEYRLNVSKTIRDSSGLNLHDDSVILFETANDYLNITSIMLDDKEVPVQADEDIYEHILQPSGRISACISFSTQIPRTKQSAALACISCNAYFPAEAANPALISANWSDPPFCIHLTWEGFSKSTPGIVKYYKLGIRGGKSGICNMAGEYLKEDECIIIKLAQ